jgi:hypothetical protein
VTYTAETLYDLLPATHRSRDAEHGHVLRGLLAVLAEQAEVLDRDIAELYDNWFVETCDTWVLPYLADLLAVGATGADDPPRRSALTPPPPGGFSRRAYVANTLGYRRRKGTVAVLEQLAPDLTGWRARAVELFELIGTTQHLDHLRAGNVRTPDLRATVRLGALGGPFDRIAHTVEVRPLEPRTVGRTERDRGRYQLGGIALFLWRLQVYPVADASARSVDPGTAGHTFHAFGLDAPLFNVPRGGRSLDHLAEESDVPGPLRRRVLYAELEARRQALVDQTVHRPVYLAADRAAFRVAVGGADDADPPRSIPPEEILICDLTTWRRPPGSLRYAGPDGATRALPISVAVDPELGRLTFPEGSSPEQVRVDLAHGSSGDIGGGPYDRRDGLESWLHEPRKITWQIGVTKDRAQLAASEGEELVATLAEAVAAWNALVAERPASSGVIAVSDSSSYRENLTGAEAIDLPAGSRLALVAAGWPVVHTPNGPSRELGILTADAPLRPHLQGRLSVRGGAGPDPGELVVQGLAIEREVTVLAGDLGSLRLIDCTLRPSGAGVTVNASAATGRRNSRLRVAIDRCLSGSVTLAETVPSLHVGDTVLQRSSNRAIEAPGAEADLQRCTVLGRTLVRALEAGNTLFTGPVVVERRQVGCVRYCHVPEEGSATPRRFRCQPDLALREVAGSADRARRRAELAPAFTSTRYGDPGYAQLALTTAQELLEGAEDGSEMGAFGFLRQPQRADRLRAAIDEFLRFGLEAGLFFVT